MTSATATTYTVDRERLHRFIVELQGFHDLLEIHNGGNETQVTNLFLEIVEGFEHDVIGPYKHAEEGRNPRIVLDDSGYELGKRWAADLAAGRDLALDD